MKISTALEKLDKGLRGPGMHNTPFERRQIFEDTCIAGRITMLDTVNGRPALIVHTKDYLVRVVLEKRDIRQLLNLYFDLNEGRMTELSNHDKERKLS